MSQAHNTSRGNRRKPPVRRARIPELNYEEMSELGRDLFDLSRAYEDSGGALLTEEELDAEVMRRRGGRVQEDAA
ncbi:MAG TPA: hypothetical protein VM914_08940 [Pyrinomonadaceae bacterium]|jgi:hypothetical protein|nr:hypothetical protein [Pyrinomonadaceae bacterium]